MLRTLNPPNTPEPLCDDVNNNNYMTSSTMALQDSTSLESTSLICRDNEEPEFRTSDIYNERDGFYLDNHPRNTNQRQESASTGNLNTSTKTAQVPTIGFESISEGSYDVRASDAQSGLQGRVKKCVDLTNVCSNDRTHIQRLEFAAFTAEIAKSSSANDLLKMRGAKSPPDMARRCLVQQKAHGSSSSNGHADLATPKTKPHLSMADEDSGLEMTPPSLKTRTNQNVTLSTESPNRRVEQIEVSPPKQEDSSPLKMFKPQFTELSNHKFLTPPFVKKASSQGSLRKSFSERTSEPLTHTTRAGVTTMRKSNSTALLDTISFNTLEPVSVMELYRDSPRTSGLFENTDPIWLRRGRRASHIIEGQRLFRSPIRYGKGSYSNEATPIASPGSASYLCSVNTTPNNTPNASPICLSPVPDSAPNMEPYPVQSTPIDPTDSPTAFKFDVAELSSVRESTFSEASDDMCSNPRVSECSSSDDVDTRPLSTHSNSSDSAFQKCLGIQITNQESSQPEADLSEESTEFQDCEDNDPSEVDLDASFEPDHGSESSDGEIVCSTQNVNDQSQARSSEFTEDHGQETSEMPPSADHCGSEIVNSDDIKGSNSGHEHTFYEQQSEDESEPVIFRKVKFHDDVIEQEIDCDEYNGVSLSTWSDLNSEVTQNGSCDAPDETWREQEVTEVSSGFADRNRSASLNFASLFSRCRHERDLHDEEEGGGGDDDTESVLRTVYNILCAERVSQMTKTYNDIEAVTRLLEEKERDLELAARIGQTLLSKNKDLASRTETLEEQLSLANERVSQLRHDIGMKDELLRIYNEDLELQHGHPTPVENKDGPGANLNMDFLYKKVQTLEDENLNLRLESAQLKADTSSYEEKEKKLVEDCIQQLAEVNQQVETLAEELHQKSEENIHQKEQITQYLAQVTELTNKVRKLTLDNMDLQEKLMASTESQKKLTKELGSMQDKYDELFEMMEEAQDELRVMRSKHKVKATGSHHHSAYGIPTDSLASELETSLQQELSQSSRRAQSWKIFETAKAAKRAAAKAERERASSVRLSVTEASSRRDSDVTSLGLSTCASDVESFNSDGYSGDMDSLYGSNPELGRPGIPGSNDLESALRRLALRRANEMNERDFMEEEEYRKQQWHLLSYHSGTTSPHSVVTTSGLRSPGGFSSASGSTATASVASGYKMSDKLQIVKPMEGSMTLRHWQHLATPHLGGIFEPRDGVQMKGERKLDLVEEVYNLSDFEEDGTIRKIFEPDEPQDVHTRKEQESGLVYTFTDSTVQSMGSYRGLGSLFDNSRHDATSSSFSNITNTSFNGEELPMQTSSPVPKFSQMSQSQPMIIGPGQHSAMQGSRSAETQSTFTMSLGLAALLQGRENTGLGQAIMRATVSQSKVTKGSDSGPPGGPPVMGKNLSASTSSLASIAAASSTPVHTPRLVSAHSASQLSESSSEGGSLSATMLKNLPGSRSFQEIVREHNEQKVLVRSAVAKKEEERELFPPGMTGQGFLQQLKSKGLSLYGLWGGAKGDASSTTDPSSVGQGQSTPPPTVAPVSQPSVAEAVLDNGAGGGAGVLGALTNFRRNGIF